MSGEATIQRAIQKPAEARAPLGLMLLAFAAILFAAILLGALSPARAQTNVRPSFAACPAADGTPEDPTYPIRQQAFASDAGGDHEMARHLMRCAIRANPHDLVALRQEVYLDLNAKDQQSAAEDIDALRAAGASTPQFEAQEGYIYADEKKYDDARLAFGRAIAGGDPAISAKSMQAIKVLDGEYPRHLLTITGDTQYLNRFSDDVSDLQVRYLERLGHHSPFQVFGNVRLLRDTASNGGTLPQIFSDNAILTGVGAQYQPHGAHFFVSAEMNEAYVFYGGKSGNGAFVPDIRTVAGYFNSWHASPDSFLGNRFSVEANGSFGFYSRYQGNAILYAQPRELYDLTREVALKLRPYFQQSLALDANQQFYNNVLELIPGFEVANTNWHGLALRAEYVRGFYLPIANQAVGANPYGNSYNDFRIRLVFEKQLRLGSGRIPR